MRTLELEPAMWAKLERAAKATGAPSVEVFAKDALERAERDAGLVSWADALELAREVGFAWETTKAALLFVRRWNKKREAAGEPSIYMAAGMVHAADLREALEAKKRGKREGELEAGD